tara:strand:- start:129 stop:368 length:240 start_codon:yes stop_codon:yes gene_type:complete
MQYIILITMLFLNPADDDGSMLKVDTYYGKPLVFTSLEECIQHVKINEQDLKDYAKYYYRNISGSSVNKILCVKKSDYV